MSEFFYFVFPMSERRWAFNVPGSLPDRPWTPCPANPRHRFCTAEATASDPINELANVWVRHNKRSDMLIWAPAPARCLVHDQLAAEMAAAGLTGFVFRPATVRFRDGGLSQEYRRLVVTGWAGMARPESGIELLESCPQCLYKEYTGLKSPGQLIDPSQWTGDDFFVVWPLPLSIFITERVRQFLERRKVRSYCAFSLDDPSSVLDTGPTYFSLSPAAYFPADLAQRYARSLRIA